MTSVKTRSVCLICLKRFGGGAKWESGNDGAYQTRMLVPFTGLGGSFSSEGQDKEGHLYTKFLLVTARYLKIPAAERLLEFAKEHKSSTGENVQAFCEDCQVLVSHVCDLYAELQTIKLHLLKKVGELETVTRLATKKVSLKLARGLIKSVSEQLNIKSVRQLELYRKCLMLNCNRKVKGSTPQVMMHRGLLPGHWKFTFSATKLSLMRLIVIFALASPPTKRVAKKEPQGILKRSRPGPLKRRTDDRRKIAFDDIAHHMYGIIGMSGRKPLAKGEDGVVIKKEGGPDSPEGEKGYFDNDDNDAGFPDTGADDNDSDWSRGAASPTGSLDSCGSDANLNSDADDDTIPRKRRRLRRTRQRLSSSGKDSGSDDDTNNDPDFESSKKRVTKRPPPLSLKDATIPCKFCTKMFVDRRGLAKHLRDIHNTHLDWNCDICGFKCRTSAEFVIHRRRLHGGTSTKSPSSRPPTTSDRAVLPCPKCKRKFIDARGLSRHMQGSHKTRLEYTCNMCGHKSKTAADHMAHRSRMHRKTGDLGPTGQGFRRQRRRMRRGLDTACRLCEEQFPSRAEFLRHNKEVHKWNERRFECPVCMKQVVNDERFKRHLLLHEKESAILRAFHCEVCGKTFYTEVALSDHFVTVHDGCYSCTLCDAKYPTSSHLRTHLESHETETKSFFCGFCFRGYTNEQYWQIHQKVAHVGNAKIFCDQDRCAEEFNTVQELNEHLKVHIDELRAKSKEENEQQANDKGESSALDVKPNPSEGNTKQDVNGDKTDKTQDNEGGDKENDQYQIYTCGTCGWGFLKKYSLVLHELVHIPYEKDVGYRCPKEDCGKTLQLKDKLISHYNHIHGAKIKPYQCHECGHRFSHFIWFKTHLRLHEERKSGRKFICNICNMECLDSVALAGHKRRHYQQNQKESKARRPGQNSAEDGELVRRGPGRPRMKPRTEEELEQIREAAEKLRNIPCEICQVIYENAPVLRKHLDKEHEQVEEEEKTIQCNFCYLKFVHEQTRQLHVISIHMQKNKFVCDAERCDEQFENHLELNEHLKKIHLEEVTSEGGNDPPDQPTNENAEAGTADTGNDGELPDKTVVKVKELQYCKICNWGFVNPDFLELHELVHTQLANQQPPQYICPGCENPFPSTTKLINHFNRIHGKKLKPYKCLECPCRFLTRATLRLHIAVHSKKRAMQMGEGEKFVCIDCGSAFSSYHKLNSHRKEHDPANHLLCPEGCGETFVNRFKLNKHLKKVHGKGERYPCPQCGIAFCYENETRKHIEWVHSPARYECDICHKKYKRPNALRIHKRNVHGPGAAINQYMCSDCGKSYRSEEGLKFHTQSVHTPDHLKKFACTACSYKTHRPMLLRGHMKVCLRNKGLVYDEAKYGKAPVQKKYTGPPRKRGRAAWKKKVVESEEEEEMEEKSTTEEEEEEEEQKPDNLDPPPPPLQQQQPLYPHLQPQAAPSSSSTANVINAIIANLTGIPELTPMIEPEDTATRRSRRGSGRRQSKELTTSSSGILPSTIDQNLFQSMTHQHQQQLAHHPQLFGNPPPQYQNWLSTSSAGPSFPHQFQHLQQQHNNEEKPDFNHTPPPPHLQQQNVYSPNHVYSPPLPDQPQNLHYAPRK